MNSEDAVSKQTAKIALIELHDSTVSGLRVQRGGDGVLSFDHLNVYVEESVGRYGIWSYRADLLLRGVERLRVDKLLPSDYILDGRVADAQDRDIDLASALQWTVADRVEIVLFESGTLSMKASSVQLNLTTPLKRYEEWIGPLK